MSAGVTSRDPAPAALNVGTRTFIRASVNGEVLSPIARSDVNVTVAGIVAVASGVVQSGFDATFLPNAEFGVDVSVRPRAPLADDSWQSVRITAPGIDDGWVFRTSETGGPRLVYLTPERGQDAQPDLPLVQFDVVDDTGAVLRRTLRAESDDGVLSGSQLTAESIDFRNTLGQLVEIDGTPAFITALIGPHIVVTTHSGGGSGLNVKLFKRQGLDVTLAGARVIASGEVLPGSGWSVLLTEPNAGQWRVVAQKTGAVFADGARVDIDVMAQDANTAVDNVSRLKSHFFIGDQTGPRVGGVLPVPGARGLSTATSTQPVIDIIDRESGVDLSTINVFVDGVQAVTNGTPSGDWSTTTVDAITDGRRVTLRKTTAWPGPQEVTCVVRASDAVGNAMPEATWLWHFGAVTETFTGSVGTGELVSDDVVRVFSFDLAQSSFARPVEMRHTGFAWDGFWYDLGTRNVNLARATWATESAGATRSARSEFPVSGYLVVTVGGWSLLDAAGRMWATCTALGSGSTADWSMAGGIGQALGDGCVANELPLLFLAAGPNLIVVDFTSDRAWRLNSGGRALSTGTISARNANAGGGAVDTDYALASTPTSFARVTGIAFEDSWLAMGVRDAQIEFAGDIDAASAAAIESVRGALAGQNHSVVLPIPGAVGGTWARVRATRRGAQRIEPLIAAYTNADGDARLVVCDWLNVFGYLQGSIATISTPIPTLESARDCDQVFDRDQNWFVAFATTDGVQILELADGGLSAEVVDDFDQVDLTLDTVVDGEISAAALGTGFTRDRGYVFVATTTLAAGKAVRYRHQPVTASPTGQIATLSDGIPIRSLAALGEGLLARERFVRASMALLTSNQDFVLASMVVE